MRLFTMVFVMIIITFLFGNLLNKIDTINHLEQQLIQKDLEADSLCNTINDLKLKMDTLTEKTQIFDFQYYKNSFKNLLDAIIQVESNNNDNAYHKGEDAVGCLQIRQTMVNDINRILIKKKSYVRYSYKDRWNRQKSVEMMVLYCNYYNLKKSEEIARCWNGGPRGINNPATISYWKKVQENLDS